MASILGPSKSVMLDTVGAEVQVVNKSSGPAISLKENEFVTLTPNLEIDAYSNMLPINYNGLAKGSDINMNTFSSSTQTATAETASTSTTDDFMDVTVNLPEIQMEEGFKDGYNEGLIKGKQDAYEVGLKHGFECGQEVGFYRGLIDIWTAAIRIKPDFFSNRVKKSVEKLNELINDYPFMNPEDESKDVVTEKMRLKFKAISATLGTKLVYKGYPKVDHDPNY